MNWLIDWKWGMQCVHHCSISSPIYEQEIETPPASNHKTPLPHCRSRIHWNPKLLRSGLLKRPWIPTTHLSTTTSYSHIWSAVFFLTYKSTLTHSLTDSSSQIVSSPSSAHKNGRYQKPRILHLLSSKNSTFAPAQCQARYEQPRSQQTNK